MTPLFENVLAKATKALGSQEKALHWLDKPNRALGGVTPRSLIETDPNSVLDEIDRLHPGLPV